MDLVRLKIPYSFLREHGHSTWRSMRFGLENGLVDPSAPKELAADQIGRVGMPPTALVSLAIASRGDEVKEYVDQLASSEPECSDEQLQAEWLYLVLAWTYEHRGDDPDPLQRVEEIYADFGYPVRIAGFVRYMPMDGPDLGSREANERRLFERWRQYLDECASTSMR